MEVLSACWLSSALLKNARGIEKEEKFLLPFPSSDLVEKVRGKESENSLSIFLLSISSRICEDEKRRKGSPLLSLSLDSVEKGRCLESWLLPLLLPLLCFCLKLETCCCCFVLFSFSVSNVALFLDFLCCFITAILKTP